MQNMQSVNIMEKMQNYQLIITENMQKSEISKMKDNFN